MKPLEAIRCTLPNCPCECFSPGKTTLRTCESCKHGWVAHALDKLGYRHIFNLGIQVEIVQPNIVFDIASLMLYGAQASPIRLKILLDRLFSVLQHEEVLQVLHGFGWTYEDYARGYILQDAAGRVLDKWTLATREEEHIILQQFLRFGETKSIAQEIILQDTRERQDLYVKQTTRNESEIKRFIERSNMSMQGILRPFDARHLFGARMPYVPPGSRLMTPPGLSNFSPPSSNRELRPPLVPASAPSPITTSPLGRLQTMQPFDFRREGTSPAVSPGLIERRTGDQSPMSESPQNLSTTTSTSAHSTPPPFTPQKISESNNESPTTTAVSVSGPMTLPVVPIPRLAESPEPGVINFSTKEEPEIHHSSIYADRKIKHLRKNSNPVKRQWMPSQNFGQPCIGPNGKKRVLCTACHKTFCDKGALKIHYSAVHLKEMHKCSVEGCNMMFSSRRSRNRHSANPNPKLHMPQKRAKLPDGATCIDDGSSPSPNRMGMRTPPTMVLSPAMVAMNTLEAGQVERGFYCDPGIQIPLFASPVSKKLKLDDSEENDEDEVPTDLTKPPARDEMEEEYHGEDSEYHGEDSVEPQVDPDGVSSEEEKSGTSSQRGTGRRKNIPSRCAQREEMVTMSDDNSDDKDPENVKSGKKIDGKTRAKEAGNGESMNGETDKGQDQQRETNDTNDMKDSDEAEDLQVSDEMNMSSNRKDYLRIDALIDQPEEAARFVKNCENGEEEGDDRSMLSNTSLMSEQDSSVMSNDSESGKINGDLSIDLDAAMDKENPRKCAICGKLFQNHFSVKIHYQNVHLKLMHPCTVEGCNATFPSKRSQNRHSSNLNLHRKLMSTSNNDEGENADDNQNFRADVIQKLYATEDGNKGDYSQSSIVSNGHNMDENGHDSNTENHSGHMNLSGEEMDRMDEEEDEREPGEIRPGIDSGSLVTCHICQTRVRDNLILKEHFELHHPKEMFSCPINGCEKIFSTRKSRNRHSHNGSLHRTAGAFKRGTLS